MAKILRKVFENFKEYFLVVTLLIISLSVLSTNEKPGVQRIKSYSFGAFAVFNSVVSDFLSIFSKPGEVEELRKTNADLMLRVNSLREKGLENIRLKKMLGFRDSSVVPLIPAKVISTLISKTQGNFIINSGKRDSIKTGMPVITDQGLVGIVLNVSNDYSLVRTLYNSNFKVAVRNQSSNIDGILSWDGTQLVIKNIPTTYDMKPGDRIISSDFSTIVPPQIPIGLIAKKETSVSGLLSDIVIQPFVELRSVRYVFVMKMFPDNQIEELELNLSK
ncbi:MAG: rod shape-determining protein MreC [Ignavibacteria bacterium GWB2_35_6b]|nr:MAG: rod shape-determining protein MreC [Ignavibacteria bacterium GWB2_35_6b]